MLNSSIENYQVVDSPGQKKEKPINKRNYEVHE